MNVPKGTNHPHHQTPTAEGWSPYTLPRHPIVIPPFHLLLRPSSRSLCFDRASRCQLPLEDLSPRPHQFTHYQRAGPYTDTPEQVRIRAAGQAHGSVPGVGSEERYRKGYCHEEYSGCALQYSGKEDCERGQFEGGG